MASRKSYLYGLGTGLIAGALLLQLASIGESAAGRLTPDQLDAAAAAKGYVLKDAHVTWFTGAELAAKVAEAEERGRNEVEAGGDADDPKAEKIFAFTIAPGSELTTVAKLLYELGFIIDYNGFLMEMEERELTGRVQAKHYRFEAIPTMDELIEVLITP